MSHPSVRLKVALVILAVWFGITPVRGEESPPPIEHQNTRSAWNLTVDPQFMLLKSARTNLSGAGIGAGFNYWATDRITLALGVTQIFASRPLLTGLMSLFTLDAGYELLNGSAGSEPRRSETRIGTQTALTIESARTLRAQAGISMGQLFLNTQGAATYSGIGAWARLDFPSRSVWNLSLSFRYMMWKNSQGEADSIQVIAGPRFYW